MSDAMSSSDEDELYVGPVRPYMFEPQVAGDAARCNDGPVSSAASSVVSDVSTW